MSDRMMVAEVVAEGRQRLDCKEAGMVLQGGV